MLTAFLGYVLFICGLMFDLGRPWCIWHPLIIGTALRHVRSGHVRDDSIPRCFSSNFCPTSSSASIWKTPIKWIQAIYPVLILAGILLSTLHQ